MFSSTGIRTSRWLSMSFLAWPAMLLFGLITSRLHLIICSKEFTTHWLGRKKKLIQPLQMFDADKKPVTGSQKTHSCWVFLDQRYVYPTRCSPWCPVSTLRSSSGAVWVTCNAVSLRETDIQEMLRSCK